MPDENIAEQVDVIIGVGIDVSKDGQYISPASAQVALLCKKLLLKQRGQNILFCGGYRYNGGPSEAETMYNFSSSCSAPRGNMFLETESIRTWQNADYTLAIMRQHHWHTAVIVAQQWQARRVRATFRRRWQGSGRRFVVTKAWSPYSGSSQKRLNSFWRFLLWDTAAWLVSRFRGYV